MGEQKEGAKVNCGVGNRGFKVVFPDLTAVFEDESVYHEYLHEAKNALLIEMIRSKSLITLDQAPQLLKKNRHFTAPVAVEDVRKIVAELVSDGYLTPEKSTVSYKVVCPNENLKIAFPLPYHPKESPIPTPTMQTVMGEQKGASEKLEIVLGKQ